MVYAALLVALSISDHARAQIPGGLMNMFNAMMGAAIVNNARVQWSKVPSNETACIEEELQQRGTSIGGLIQNGIAPNDPRVASVRFGCRTAALSPSEVIPNAPIETGSLSEKPTFDCSKARSLTARTMCLDLAGASADWDLITAYWARYFTLAEGQRQRFDQGQRDWLDSLNQKCPGTRNPQECVLTAYHRRAAAYRSQLVGDGLAEARLTPEQHAKIQQSLIELGYLNGDPDGEFGSNTRAAIRRFKALSGAAENEFLTAQESAQLLHGTAVAVPSSCRVMDPTGTPLNVREEPNGVVVDTLTNGTLLQVLGIQQDSRGREWARVQTQRALGWAFRDYIDCSPTRVAQAPTSPGPPPPQAPPQPPPPPKIEAARLKEAHIFLDDAKKFINQQKSVSSISEIAEEAAILQLALNQFDEHRAVESMRKLNDLLRPIPSFTEFVQQQKTERNREEARQLSEGRIQAKENESFIDGYLRSHLGDPKTEPLLSQRAQIESALKLNSIEEITEANDAVASYATNNGLIEAYAESKKRFEHPEPSPPHTEGTLRDRLTPKSMFLVEGPADEIMLLYNASPTAPKVWKNVRGDVVFQDDTASICFAQPDAELAITRYVDHYLGDRGAKKIISVSPPCDLSSVGKTIDVIAFQRGELLKSREDYVLALAKMAEGETFRRYEAVKDYASVFQKRQALSLQFEAEVDNNSRKGFGVIAANTTAIACVIPPSQPDRSDGLKELLKRNADAIAPALTAEWQFVDTPTNDLAFLGLQRQQCGYLLGDDNALRAIMLALRRQNLKYSFAPVWWNEKELDQATFDAHDAAQEEILKRNDLERKQKGEEALQEQRKKNQQSEKTEIERKLREANGTKARGLMNYIHDLVSAMAEQRPVADDDLFPTYSNWLNRRFADQWETFNVSSDVEDFGTAQWEHRPLDAVVVKTIVHQKNRILGKYEDRCYLFGFVSDDEFSILRDSFAFNCGDTPEVDKWKVGERFKSQWNAD